MKEKYYEVYAYLQASDVIECDTLEEAYKEAKRLSNLWNCKMVITKVEKTSFVYEGE